MEGVDEVASVSAEGEVMVNDCELIHPFASVTVHVYVPAARFDAVDAFPPEGDQA